MSRRAVLSIAVACLVGLCLAAFPWTLSREGLSLAVSQHLRQQYGVDLTVNGRATFALLPTPRVKFQDVALQAPGTSLHATGGTLRADLDILPLLVGRVALGAVSLSDSRISGSYTALKALDWSRLVADDARHVRVDRFVLAGSSMTFTDRPDDGIGAINMVFAWSAGDDVLSASGSASWRGEPVAVEQVEIQPVAAASGLPGRVTLTASVPASQIFLDGKASWGTDPRFDGKSVLKTTSLGHVARWSGMDVPFGPLLQAVSVEGMVSLDRRRLSWPSVNVTMGSDALDGTLAVRFDGVRPLVTGTLAASAVDLSDVVRPITQAMTSSGTWSEESLDLARMTGSDLDLRLSASKARFGQVRLGDMAASVLVRPGSIETSLGRGTFHDGTLKGRLSLTSVEGGTEFKAQGAFDNVDMAAFLGATGQGKWLQGPGQGQFMIAGTGPSPAAIVRNAAGRSNLLVKNGELVGIGLTDAMRRVEKRPLAASLNWKGGRTPFDQAQVHFTVADGMAELSDSRLTAPGLTTGLSGRVSLMDRVLDLKADVAAITTTPSTNPALVFDLTGHWQNVIVSPDARSLIQRSGAAQPLFGKAIGLVAPSRPLANAQ